MNSQGCSCALDKSWYKFFAMPSDWNDSSHGNPGACREELLSPAVHQGVPAPTRLNSDIWSGLPPVHEEL